MKAYPLILNNPLRYQKHIVTIGSFHGICAYLKMLDKKMNVTGLTDLLELPSGTTIEVAKTDDEISSIVKDYNEFKESVRAGDIGKTAKLWISYMDHVLLILNINQAVKYNDYPLLSYSAKDGRYLFLLSMDRTKPAIWHSVHPSWQIMNRHILVLELFWRKVILVLQDHSSQETDVQ